MKAIPILLVLILGLVLPLRAAPGVRSPATVTARPVIEQVRGRMVRVRVPAGLHSITVEQCTNPRENRWQVAATKLMEQKPGVVDLAVPRVVSRRFLRVKGTLVPAAPGALVGARLFLADPAATGGGPFSLTGFGRDGDLGAVTSTGASSADTAPRLVAESDIWRLAGDRLYFFNELRGLQVFDIANPDDPALLGQLRASGRGEQMYLLDSPHVVLLLRSSNFIRLPVITLAAEVASPEGGDRGEIVVVDVAQGRPVEKARVSYRGALRESRRVGQVLYVVSEAWTGQGGELVVTSFDLRVPSQPVQRATLTLPGWNAVIHATDRFLFVASRTADWTRSNVEVIDISSPTGALTRRGRIAAAGQVEDKFKMHLDGDIFTVVSQIARRFDGTRDLPAPTDPNASRTAIETFSLARPDAPVALGSLEVGHGEVVHATRFDEKRLYVVTFFQIDPLWVVDLSRPAQPTLLGELKVPGFSTYIEPLGDRLVSVGRLEGRTAVSLFDVSDPARPITLSQLPLGDGSSWSEADWTEKAFNVLPEENLIVVPYSGYDPATGHANRVQLIDLTRDALVKRGVVEHPMAARRTAVKGNRLLALSATDLVTVDFADRDRPRVTSEVEIAWRVDRVFLAGQYLVQVGGAADWHANQPQTVSVSTASAPETVLTTVALDPAPVLGATVRDARLYLVQRHPRGHSDLIYAPDRRGSPTAPAANPLILTVFDLTSLPALPRLARTESEVPLGYFTALEAAWPSPGVLVWVRQAQSYFRGPWFGRPAIGDMLPIIFSGTPVSPTSGGRVSPRAGVGALPAGDLGLSARIWPGWGNVSAGTEAIVFDVRTPGAPVLAAQLHIRVGSTGDWSAPFVADGKLYVSAMAYEDFVTIGEKPAVPANTPSRRFRHFLKVVDFTNPAQPVTGPDINIPGRLIGLSNAGARLYTVGCRYESDGAPLPTRALHVSTFEGVAATFVDQLPLADSGAAYALDLDTVLLGVRGAQGQPDRIAAWQLGADAKFQRRSETETADASWLGVVRGLMVAGGFNGPRQAYDVTDAVNVRPLGPLPERVDGWSAPDLGAADGTPTRGLWEPLGRYGVEFVEFAP